jgi:hypothetical protein
MIPILILAALVLVTAWDTAERGPPAQLPKPPAKKPGPPAGPILRPARPASSLAVRTPRRRPPWRPTVEQGKRG